MAYPKQTKLNRVRQHVVRIFTNIGKKLQLAILENLSVNILLYITTRKYTTRIGHQHKMP